MIKKYFQNDFPDVHEDLGSVKKAFSTTHHTSNTQDAFVDYLHEKQISLLKKKSITVVEKDIEKITAQGIASYLGRSG